MQTTENKLLNLISMRALAPFVMMVLAIAAIVASGFSTFDISFHLSPADFAVTVGLLTVLVVDGGFLALDFVFPYVKTATARSLVALFMAILWLAMVGTNVADAIFNMAFDASKLGWGSWIMYAVKVIGLVYLAMYAYIRFDDPETKRILQQTEIDEIKNNELLAREREYSELMAIPYAKAMAIENIRSKFKAEHNKNIEDVIGKDWVREFLPADLPVEIAPANQDKPKPASKTPVIPTLPVIPPTGFIERAKNILQIGVASKDPTGPQARG